MNPSILNLVQIAERIIKGEKQLMLTVLRYKVTQEAFEVRDEKCAYAECLEPGWFILKNNNGEPTLECRTRCLNGCPTIITHDDDLRDTHAYEILTGKRAQRALAKHTKGLKNASHK